MLAMTQLQAEMSTRSRSSGSSTSSLSSTFSDTTCSTSATSSSPPHSRTDAFFASPFSTRPPSPEPQQTPQLSAPRQAESKHSLNTDFFAMSMESSSSPPSSSKTLRRFTSRIFPSRYTSTARRSPEFAHPNEETHYNHLHDVLSLEDSDPSFSSALESNTRLPTPPPPSLVLYTNVQRSPSESTDQSTPRPPHVQPSCPSLLLTRATPEHNLTYEMGMGMNDPEVDELQTGRVISIPLSNTAMAASPFPSPHFSTFAIGSPSSAPDWDRQSPTPKSSTHTSIRPSPSTHSMASLSSLSSGSSKISTNTDRFQSPSGISISNSTTVSCPTFVMDPDLSSTALRLLKCLGHGAFSSVWLAEDLSHIPLTLLAKKSVRYLRRKESGRGRTKVDNKETECTIANAQPDQSSSESNKRPPSRLREGLKNMLSFSRSGPFNFTSSSSTARSQNPVMVVSSPADFDPLSRHPTLPSHHPYLSSHLTLGDDISGMSTLPSIPPSSQSFSSNLAASSSNLNLHLTIEGGTYTIAGSLSRDSSLRKFRARVSGTRPGLRLAPGKVYLDERDGEMGEPVKPSGSVVDEFGFLQVGEEGRLSRHSSLGKSTVKDREKDDRLVAVKVTPRRVQGIGPKNGNGCANAKEEEERTRVRFVREVEVLKHISHPNITPLLAHLSTPTDHILVLPYLPGGDLLNLVNNDVAWRKMGESLLRRMWCELCKAVGWMHGVGLVHRDIKLENILLTTTAFTSLIPDSTSLNLPTSSPLIKLTDFGLSRFVDLDETTGEAELLTTRCGSEAYAAPELVIGGRGSYDARKTDAWACGVVLYALVGRKLPFGEGVGAFEADGNVIGGERGVRNGWAASVGLAERKHWLMRIARGEWVWPGDEMGGNESDLNTIDVDLGKEELVGCKLVKSRGARRVVERLLVRDPRKRARVVDLWEDEWMFSGGIGVGGLWWREKEWCRVKGEQEKEPSLVNRRPMREKSPSPPVIVRDFDSQQDSGSGPMWIHNNGADRKFQEGPCADGDCESIEGEEEEEEGGCLFDQEGIDSITRQEVL